jgi:hypothetical protein
MIAEKMDNIREARIAHNMLVCQVATFSPICIPMTLQDCADIDKTILKQYHFRLKLMHHDAQHFIFLPESKGGIGVKSFTMQYISALLRDIEVYITNKGSMPAHALITSLAEATKLSLWILKQDEKFPTWHKYIIE